MTTPERFTVLTGGPSRDERDARLADGADALADAPRRASLLSNDRLLLAIAASCMTFGLSAILLGWWGAANSTHVEEQLPYLISGGLFGVALGIIGAMCVLAHWLTALLRESRARETARQQDHADLLDAVRSLVTALENPQEQTNGSARSKGSQRPIRRAPRSS